MGGRVQVQWRSICALCALLLAACQVFDRDRLLPFSEGGQGGMGGGSGSDAGGEDSGVCVPKAETCNGVDEDCDGVDDLEDEDAREWCEPMVVNAEARCALSSAGILCARYRCDEGFISCDGDPSNGCEVQATTCEPCADCDAGDDDGGE
jgi:hypothetical protein